MRTPDEFKRLGDIERILFPAGAKNENEKRDALIVFNADKNCDILITDDRNTLKKRARLSAELNIKWIMADFEAVVFVRKRIGYRDAHAKQMEKETGENLPSWVGQD